MKQNKVNILIGTNNKHKVREIKSIWRLYRTKVNPARRLLKFISLSRFTDISQVKEDGNTYLANAAKKACTWAKETGFVTLAEDSGLEVKLLKGKPGIFSARYALSQKGDKETIDINKLNNEEVLRQLLVHKQKDRTACYKCFGVLASGNGKVIFKTSGICRGKIAQKPTGRNGFGYDPIFIPSEQNLKQKTFGQLPLKVKHQISHRARVMHHIFDFIIRYANNFKKKS